MKENRMTPALNFGSRMIPICCLLLAAAAIDSLAQDELPVSEEIRSKEDLSRVLREALSRPAQYIYIEHRSQEQEGFKRDFEIMRLITGDTDFKGLSIKFQHTVMMLNFFAEHGWQFDWVAPAIYQSGHAAGRVLVRIGK